MTINHHPSEESIARYAAGRLEAGPALVLSVHLAGCPHCRGLLRTFEAVGGALIEDMPPAEMAEDALEVALARLDADAQRPARRASAPQQLAPRLGDVELPAALAGCEIGPWRWMGPGFRLSRVRLPGEPDANILLMRISAGRKMPEHGHTGREFTQILSGSFSDSNGRYRAGDLAEEDSETEHQPIVDRESECICLAAVEGRMKLQGFVARMVQPLLGF